MDFELKNFEDKINDITEQFMSLLDSNKGVEDTIKTRFDNPTSEDGIFKFESLEGTATNDSAIPSHAIRFDEADELNKRLEELYNAKKYNTAPVIKEPQLAFADYGLGGFNTNVATFSSENTNDKIYSANEKEVNNMANYEYNANEDNSIFSFATVPQERALAPQRSFSDVLFMDIPWDTKIDIWGGIKSLFTTEVRFTF